MAWKEAVAALVGGRAVVDLVQHPIFVTELHHEDPEAAWAPIAVVQH